MTGTRHRCVVLTPAVAVCAVCRGAAVVTLVALAGLRGAGQVACPHCAAGSCPVPILSLPVRRDHPRGETA